MKSLKQSTKDVERAVREVNERSGNRVPSNYIITSVAQIHGVDVDYLHKVGAWDRRSICMKRKKKKRS